MKHEKYQINGNWYLAEQLVEGAYEIDDEYLLKAMNFCREWLSSKKEFIQQTSGSTGVPKKITINRRQMEASAKFTCEALQLHPGMHALICVNVDFIAGKMMLIRCLEHGMHMTIIPPSANPLLAVDNSSTIDFTAMVPLQVSTILENRETASSFLSIKNVIVGGAALSDNLKTVIEKLGVDVYATYGMTETVSHIALQKLNGAEKQEYFQAFPEVKLGQDERGCLTIESILTNHQKIITNDVVDLIAPHTFRWLGRADNIINSGGIKIQIEVLEKKITNILAADNIALKFAITNTSDDKLGEKTIMVIENRSMDSTVKKILKKYLPAYEVPKSFILVPQLPYTASGKLDRQTLKNILNERCI